MDRRFLDQMQSATRLLNQSNPLAATAVIQRALGEPSAPRMQMTTAIAPPTQVEPHFEYTTASSTDVIIDVELVAESVAESVFKSPAKTAPRQGKFLNASLSNHTGSRAYKLYVPSRYDPGSDRPGTRALPLIVMLHGCQQNPDDFALGTTMNEIAEEHDCFVAYPAQTSAKNMSNCWNWFNTSDQSRDHGEPAIIADIARRVIREYSIDTRRVYVAGLSAGGAMAAIMGKAYPDLFAAIGVHSGLPVGAAHDMVSAFAAMQRGAKKTSGRTDWNRRPNGAANHSDHDPQGMPIIVFHGDRDTTVHPANATQIISQFVSDSARMAKNAHFGDNSGDQYTQSIHFDATGKVIAEQWLIHQAGHAWSGGSAAGSYTEPNGPNASREMLRFFLGHSRALKTEVPATQATTS